MSYKPSKEQLAAYLYGELSEEEMAQVASYLEAHPEEKENLQILNNTRLIFNELQDEELLSPIQFKDFEQPKPQWHYWRPYIGIAASLLVILTFAWLTNFGLSYQQGEFHLGYRKVVEGMSPEEVQTLIAKDRKATIKQFQAYVDASEDSIQGELKMINATLDQQTPDLLLAAEKQAIMDDMLNLSETLSADYREILRELVVNFSNNIEAQRIQDLQNIQAAFNDLEDATLGNQLDIEDELIRLSDRIDAVIASLNNNQ